MQPPCLFNWYVMNVFKDKPDIFSQWFRNNSTMMLVSGQKGEIYEANNEFLEFIGYTLHEFQREEFPVTWFDITTKDEDFDSDMYESKSLVRGEKKSYSIKKHYIPKQSIPKLVQLQVSRYPQSGASKEFEFFLVEVHNLDDQKRHIFEEMEKMNLGTSKSLQAINRSIEDMSVSVEKTIQCLDILSTSQELMFKSQKTHQEESKSKLWNTINIWTHNNPKLSSVIVTFFILLFSTLLFGDRAIQIFTNVYNIIYGEVK